MDILSQEDVKDTYSQLRGWKSKTEERLGDAMEFSDASGRNHGESADKEKYAGPISQSVLNDEGSTVVAPVITNSTVTDISVDIESSTASKLNNKQPAPTAVAAEPSSNGKPGICSNIVSCSGSNVVTPIMQHSNVAGFKISIKQSQAAAQPDPSKNVKKAAAASVEYKKNFLKNI